MPTLFVAGGAMSPFGRMTLWILLGATVLATPLFLRRGAVGRPGGWLLIAGYAGFAGFVIAQ